jgi:cell division protein FtsL
MATAYRQTGRPVYAPATKIYAPTRGSLAYAPGTAVPQPQPEPVQRPTRPQPAGAARTAAVPRFSNVRKAAIVFACLLVAAMFLMVLFRYEKISAQYATVNGLKSQIEETQLRLKALNVQLQCAVSIDDAREAAQNVGMTYPDASQFVPVTTTGISMPESTE